MKPNNNTIVDLYANTEYFLMSVDTTEDEYISTRAIVDTPQLLYKPAKDRESY